MAPPKGEISGRRSALLRKPNKVYARASRVLLCDPISPPKDLAVLTSWTFETSHPIPPDDRKAAKDSNEPTAVAYRLQRAVCRLQAELLAKCAPPNYPTG